MLEISYHGLDVRMWHCGEFMEVKLEVRSDVDVGSLVFSRVAVPWG